MITDKQDNYDYLLLDLETSHLEPVGGTILEIACHVLKPDLTPVGKLFHECIHQSEEDIKNMSDWSRNHHSQSGLLKVCEASTETVKDVEKRLLDYLISLGYQSIDLKEKTGLIITGNSVGFDLGWIKVHMPKLARFLHYRIFDISSLNIAMRAWAPNVIQSLVKQYAHRADDDIRETLKEMKIYRMSMVATNGKLEHKTLQPN